MRPVLFEFGGIPIPTHEFFIGVGVLAAIALYIYLADRRGRLTEHTMWIVVGALVTGAVFAKISTVWRFFPEADGLADLWLYGGRSILGGLAGAYLGVVVTKRLLGYRQSTGDLFAPAIALGMAIGRVGCFLTEQIGTATTMPWGITLSPAVAATVPACPACATGQPMHPSFLYEIGFHVAAFAVLWSMRDRVSGDGTSFKGYLLAYGVFRFALEFVRGNPKMAFGLSGSQLFLLATLPLLFGFFARRWRLQTRRTLVEAT